MSRFDDLSRAIGKGNISVVAQLLGEDPELVNACDFHGFTPLMQAVSRIDRNVELVRFLLNAGADVNRQTGEGYTALHCAIDVDGDARHNAVAVIELLTSAGADLSLRQHYGWTPLLDAIEEGRPAEVDALLAAGANPNDCLPLITLPAFNSGRTALTAALSNPYAEAVVAALLRAGGDPLLRDGRGMTFFECAIEILAQLAGSPAAEKVRRCVELARKWGQRDA